VSIEIGGMVSAYDVSPSAGVAHGSSAIQTTGLQRGQIMLPSAGTGGNAPSGITTGNGQPNQAIAAFEVRPTITLESGFLMGVGFRTGQAGLGDKGSALVGGDISLGYAKRFGPFLPFLKAVFGFNSYDVVGPSSEHQTDLRLDAVLGTRLYLGKRLYIAASGFAGWGDRYGGTLAVGGDVIQVFKKGVMP
jgi:hypothetical protein